MDPLKRKSSNDFSQNPGISVSSSYPTDEDLDSVPEGLLDSVLSFLAAPLYFPYTPQSDESDPQGQNPLTSSNDPQFAFASGSSSGSKQLNDWDDGDEWLSIEDVKLLTEPSSTPVPSRRPPSVPSLDDGGQKEIEKKPFASSSSSSTVKPTTQAGPATDPERDVIISTLTPSTSSPQFGGRGVPSVSAVNSTTTFTVPRADYWTWVLDAALKSKSPNSEPVREQALQRGPENGPDNVAAAAQSLPQHQSQSQQQQLPNLDIATRAARETEIKQWAAGKVGNLRALLSSLHEILWPGCGWSPVSLAELITPASVKKVYRAALLHVHPDKIQRVGATAEQKYIAESVFNLLNEAFRTFNTQELH